MFLQLIGLLVIAALLALGLKSLINLIHKSTNKNGK